jgi:ABC-type xylose transport system permease subunit
VQPATTALHHAAIPAAAGRELPPLQDATFGSATMGWLDLVAPALLGVVAGARRLRAAIVSGLVAGAWGLLLLATPTIPATVPALAGLLAARL